MYHLGNDKPHPYRVQLKFNGKDIIMEIDTGAATSIISKEMYDDLFPDLELNNPSINLRTYTGELIPLAGEVRAKVEYEKQVKTLSLVVIQGKGPALLGRDWLRSLKLNWPDIAVNQIALTTQERLEKILKIYGGIFREELGEMKNVKVKLSMKEGAVPKFYKPRPVPFALKDAIGQELDRLEKRGILEKVTFSDWAAPIVPVPKPNGTLRLCGDYKVTANTALEADKYPLPKPEDLFTALTGGKQFSKLDLKEAYQQIVLEEESRKYVTINTHQGLYQFTRVPYGISSAPTMFQKVMDTLLQGTIGVICYIDDILVTGQNEEEHLDNLAEVLKRLHNNGLRLKKEKCEFLKESVEFLGYKIDRNGLHTTSSKIEAMCKAPRPENQKQLKSFLGLIQYYSKFIPNLSTLLYPLNQLLRKETKWEWTPECQQSFEEAKQRLSSTPVLAHYDPNLPLVLAGDASQ